MKKILCIILFILMIWGCGNGTDENDTLFTFTILQTSDIHHHASGSGPFSDFTPYDINDNDGVAGGYSRLASVILQTIEEQSNGGIPVLLFDSGDFLMGTVYDLTAEDPIGLKFLSLMGYDAVTFGNHEFDWAPDGLAMLISNALNSTTLPFSTPIVASNMITDATANDDDNLEVLIGAGVILKNKIIDMPYGIRIGILGLLGPDAAEKSPLASPLTFDPNFPFIQQLVDDLRENQGADIVVALSHGGVYEDGTGDDEELARNVSGIDIIASGHYHTATYDPFYVMDSIIFSPGKYGEYISKLDVTYNVSKDYIVGYSFSLIPVDDSILGNSTVQEMVKSYNEKIDLALAPLSLSESISGTEFLLETLPFQESGLGNLCADAIRAAANYFVLYSPSDPTPVSLGVLANGLIRSSLRPGKTGIITPADIYSVLPLGITPDPSQTIQIGYPLMSVYITAPEIRNVCEISISLAPDISGEPDYFLNLSGIRFDYNPSLPLYQRVTNIYLCDDPYSSSCDTELDLMDTNTLYRVSVNLYAFQMLNMVTDMGLIIEPKDFHGTSIDFDNPLVYMEYRIDSNPSEPGIQELKEWMALMKYLNPNYPDTGEDIPESVYGAGGIAMGRMHNMAPGD